MDEPEPIIAFEPPVTCARRDGWTGERMAIFLEVLAETGIVEEACRAAARGGIAARTRATVNIVNFRLPPIAQPFTAQIRDIGGSLD